MSTEHENALRILRSEQDYIRTLVRKVDERIDHLADAIAARHAPARIPEAEPTLPLHVPIFKAAPAPTSPPPVASAPRVFPRAELPRPEAAPPPSSEPNASREPASGPDSSDSFELRFGRVWLVRIGIVILLTGFVFLGNLAYQHIVPRLGPGAKLLLIYLAGGALGGIGLWLERAREMMRNYARVLVAGGCATFYYATYAAHFVQPLKVIESPLIGGALLLALAGGIGWVAHRRKSETLAVLAVLLSYYTSGLNPIGGFTLFSSLLLTATAIFFLLKHQWVRLTFVSLMGTYLSYTWSRHYLPHVGPQESTLATQMLFLGGYWLLFTAGAFFTRRESMPPSARTPFLTLNNGAFFALGTLETLRVFPSNFWMFSLGFGVILLILSRLARWKDPEDHTFDSAYLVQGITLTTLGFATKLTGYQFSLTLAAQSVILLFGAERNRLLRIVASLLSVAGAVGFSLPGLVFGTPHSESTAAAVILVLIFDAWFFKRKISVNDDARSEPVAMTLLLVAAGLFTAWAVCALRWPHFLPCLALTSVACAFLPLVYRFRELSTAGQVLFPIASMMWGFGRFVHPSVSPGVSGMFIVIAVGLSTWWAREQKLTLGDGLRNTLEGVTALCAAGVAGVWMVHRLEVQALLLAASMVGPAWIALALILRARMLGALGLGFTAIVLAIYSSQQHRLSWLVGLVPIAHVLVIAGLSRFAAHFGENAVSLATEIRRVAIVLAGGMMFLWIFAHIPREWQALFFAAVGATCSLIGAGRQVRELSITGVALGAIAWILAVCSFQTAPTWQQLAAVIVFPAACRVARKFFPADPTHQFTPQLSWAAMTGITIWVLRWAGMHDQLMSLTIIWTLLALAFSAVGLTLRDRHYRMGGLILLSLSVGRVFFVDVWNFDQVYRILSFIILGVVLLLVGYFYNRFEEKLRRWL